MMDESYREKQRAWCRAYYHKNKEKQKAYRLKNKEKYKAYWKKACKKWRDKNIIKCREKSKIYKKEYQKTENGKRTSNRSWRKRRANQMNIIEAWSPPEYLDKLKTTKGFCQNCDEYFGIAHLELDHIYPVSKASKDYLRNGIKKVYKISDIDFLCRGCNAKKGSK